jgi:hypothetical protein
MQAIMYVFFAHPENLDVFDMTNKQALGVVMFTLTDEVD